MGALDLDPLTLTAAELQKLLTEKKVTSVDLVELYLAQIEKHNRNGMKLHAIICTAPEPNVFRLARTLDEEREDGNLRGPMHGIPIIVKDTFLTPSLKMGTTCGSFALFEQRTTEDAAAVTQLVRAGCIVIGKANLSEFGSYKASNLTSGWSAFGGQTQSPYVRGGVRHPTPFAGHSTPGGSSSGSTVGVAAGFAPVSIGTETLGSIVQPASRAALYGLKASLGWTNTAGVLPGGSSFDCLGGLAKTPLDLANLMSVLMGGRDFSNSLKSSWFGVNVGFVDATLWESPVQVCEPDEEFRKQLESEIAKACHKIAIAGARVVSPVQLLQFSDLLPDIYSPSTMEDLILYGFRNEIGDFLALYPDSPVKSLKDLIGFIKEHARSELPEQQPKQDWFEAMLNLTMSQDLFETTLATLRKAARAAIDKVLRENSIDVILGPSDCMFATMASAAGYPVASMPLGFADFNGRAFGVHVLARTGEEDKILRVMCAWEATFPEARRPPPLLVNWETNNSSLLEGFTTQMDYAREVSTRFLFM